MFNFPKLHILPIERISVFRMALRTNSDYCPYTALTYLVYEYLDCMAQTESLNIFRFIFAFKWLHKVSHFIRKSELCKNRSWIYKHNSRRHIFCEIGGDHIDDFEHAFRDVAPCSRVQNHRSFKINLPPVSGHTNEAKTTVVKMEAAGSSETSIRNVTDQTAQHPRQQLRSTNTSSLVQENKKYHTKYKISVKTQQFIT